MTPFQHPRGPWSFSAFSGFPCTVSLHQFLGQTTPTAPWGTCTSRKPTPTLVSSSLKNPKWLGRTADSWKSCSAAASLWWTNKAAAQHCNKVFFPLMGFLSAAPPTPPTRDCIRKGAREKIHFSRFALTMKTWQRREKQSNSASSGNKIHSELHWKWNQNILFRNTVLKVWFPKLGERHNVVCSNNKTSALQGFFIPTLTSHFLFSCTASEHAGACYSPSMHQMSPEISSNPSHVSNLNLNHH